MCVREEKGWSLSLKKLHSVIFFISFCFLSLFKSGKIMMSCLIEIRQQGDDIRLFIFQFYSTSETMEPAYY